MRVEVENIRIRGLDEAEPDDGFGAPVPCARLTAHVALSVWFGEDEGSEASFALPLPLDLAEQPFGVILSEARVLLSAHLREMADALDEQADPEPGRNLPPWCAGILDGPGRI